MPLFVVLRYEEFPNLIISHTKALAFWLEAIGESEVNGNEVNFFSYRLIR